MRKECLPTYFQLFAVQLAFLEVLQLTGDLDSP